MLPVNLFFSKSLGEYYVIGDVECSRCKIKDFSSSENYLFVLRNYHKKDVKVYFFCSKCYKLKLSDLNDGIFSYCSFLPAKIISSVEFLPSDVKIDKSNEFEFTCGKNVNCPNVRDVAVSNKGVYSDFKQCKLVDNTKLAGRECFDGFKLSCDFNKLKLIDDKREEFAKEWLN